MKSLASPHRALNCCDGVKEHLSVNTTSAFGPSNPSIYSVPSLGKDTGRYSSGTSALCDRASTSVSRSSIVAHAQGRRRGADDDVDLDDEEYFDNDQGFELSPILQQAWGFVGRQTERLADVAYDYVPESVSRSTVVLAVRAAFVLLLIGFARSILGFVFTVGTVVLGLFVASRVLGIEAGQGRQGKGRGGKGQKWGSGGNRDPRMHGSRMRRRPPRQLPSGLAKDADVLDVWFERKEEERDRRR